MKLRNPGTNEITLFCRVDNPGADGTEHCVTHSLPLASGQIGVLKVPLKRTSDDTLGGKLSKDCVPPGVVLTLATVTSVR